MDLGGLNLDAEGPIPTDQWHEFAELHGSPMGYPDGLPMLRFWNEFRPDQVRTHRINMRHNGPHMPGISARVPTGMADLHISILERNSYLVNLEFFIARYYGWSKEAILDVVAVATIDSGSLNLEHVSPDHIAEMMRAWPETQGEKATFPNHWPTNLSALESGIDLTEPGMTPEEVTLLCTWYRNLTGEVPPWLDYVAKLAPGFLKTQRLRWERALQASPPAALPFYRLHHAVMRGRVAAIRENALLGLGLGMSLTDVIDTVVHGLLMASGPTSAVAVQQALGDTLLADSSEMARQVS